MPNTGMIPLASNDIPIDRPISWTIFDQDGNVAYRPGSIFRGREEIVAALRTTPLFRAEPKATASVGVTASAQAPIAESSETETTLDDIALHIGEPWQIQPVSDFDQRRYYVKLVGYMKSRSVIVTTPTVDGKALLIRDGQNFIVRAFSGKSAYAFKTSVIKSVGSPFPYLHLAYPETVKGMIVRQNQRIMVNVIASVVPRHEGLAKASGVIRNVSKSGASLLSKVPLGERGDGLELSFQLNVEGNDYLITVEGIIRAIRPGPVNSPGMQEFGIQFEDVKPIDQLILTAYVNALIAQTENA